MERNIDTIAVFNAIPAGIAATSAGCSVLNPWWAFTNGIVAGILLIMGLKAINALRIDDVCGISVVHGLCGLWGAWAVGIFCTDDNVLYAGYPNLNNACGRGEQFGVQVAGSLVILVWSLATSGLVFGIFALAVGLRARPIDQGQRKIEAGTETETETDRDGDSKKSIRTAFWGMLLLLIFVCE